MTFCRNERGFIEVLQLCYFELFDFAGGSHSKRYRGRRLISECSWTVTVRIATMRGGHRVGETRRIPKIRDEVTGLSDTPLSRASLLHDRRISRGTIRGFASGKLIEAYGTPSAFAVSFTTIYTVQLYFLAVSCVLIRYYAYHNCNR